MKQCFMKKMLLLMGCALATAVSIAQNAQPEIAIIPEPVSITKNTGTFTLPQQLTIAAGSSDSLKPVLTFLKDHLSKPTGLPVNVGDGANAAVQLVLNKTPDAPLGTEGYKLSVKPNGAIITANATAGLFYGVQTLLQLFPKEIESDSAVANINWQAPCV